MRTRVLAALAIVLAGLTTGGRARAGVPEPVVTGPVEGGIRGHALFDSWFDLAPFGYTEAEYFVSGTASGTGSATAPYTTRVIVTRPASPADFNGSVLLDWVNVTAQFENAVDSLEARDMLLREGFAIVHASVQASGVCCTPLTPKIWDPVRYAPLSHPGDDFAFDIYSQIAVGIRSLLGGGGFPVERVIAAGQSQSASRLYTYVTTVQPSAGVIDGFLIHGVGQKTYAATPAAPVLHLLSDSEASASSPNQTVNYRLWEIAGTAHSDFWLGYTSVVGSGPRVLLDAPKRPASDVAVVATTAGNYGEIVHPMDLTCVLAGATMPMRYAASAAIHALDAWLRTGVAPPDGPRFAFDESGTLRQDEHGNTLGGIRLPPVDVPVARYVSTLCDLGGITIPFSDVQLRMLYPSHAAYYARMAEKTDAAVAAAWLLPEDAADLLARACAARVRFGPDSPSGC